MLFWNRLSRLKAFPCRLCQVVSVSRVSRSPEARGLCAWCWRSPRPVSTSRVFCQQVCYRLPATGAGMSRGMAWTPCPMCRSVQHLVLPNSSFYSPVAD